jgi:hypothetical protein
MDPLGDGRLAVHELRALAESGDWAAVAVGLCGVRGAFAGAAGSPTTAPPDRHQLAELLRGLTGFLERGSTPNYARYAAIGALKETLLWLVRCCGDDAPASDEGRACCKRLVLLLLGGETRHGVWCGRVLEELLRTLKAWQKDRDHASGAHVESLRLLLREAAAALPGLLERYLYNRSSQHAWLRAEQALVAEDVFGVAAERDAAALAFSLLHRCIRCQLDWGGGADPAGTIAQLAELCFGHPAQTRDADGWGRGFGWACLRRKCVAVLLASDLGEKRPSDPPPLRAAPWQMRP